MTRERAGDYDEKKQTILDCAAELFGRKGFEVSTMAEVAKLCGTSKSHLYHYFPAKEDLLFAIVNEHINTLSAALTDAVGVKLPAAERFARFVDVFVQRAARSRNEHLVLMNELNFLPDAERKEVRRKEAALVDLMVDLLTEINPRRMTDVKARAPYAMLLYGMMIWTLTWYRKGGPVTPADLAARIADVYVNGFGSEVKTPPAAETPARTRRTPATRP